MSMSDMKLVRQWRAYVGPRDERLEAENCRIYRIGFLLLSFGMLLFFLYNVMASQVAWVHSDSSAHIELFSSPLDFALFLWFLVTMVICCVLQSRKGFVETNRFGQTDTFPIGYFALIAGISGGVSALVLAAMRCIAELQIVRADEVFWLANFCIGLVFGVSIFAATLLGFYLQFRSAKKHRAKIDAALDE